jgi:hypothetical protein
MPQQVHDEQGDDRDPEERHSCRSRRPTVRREQTAETDHEVEADVDAGVRALT